MRIRTILAAAAAPAALAAVLLGTAGQASAATTASKSDVSAYFYNPSGNALGGPQAMGQFDPSPNPTTGPIAQFSQGQYLAKVTEKLNNADLTGKTIEIKGHLDLTSPQFKGYKPEDWVNQTPRIDARIFFVGAGGVSDQSPQGYMGQSWWANDGTSSAVLDLTKSGDFDLKYTVDPLSNVWSDWNGKYAVDNQALFAQAASHVRELGLSFGGGYFFENGVTGTGGLTITSITVLP
jgi:hypothetical protein